MEKLDLGLAASLADTATSGIRTGDNTSGGGLKVPQWLVPLVVVCVFVFAVVEVLRS